MPRALRVCPTVGCPNLTNGGRCGGCEAKAEEIRGTATQRGYGHAHRNRFRRGVLRRDPICVCTDQSHGHGARCDSPSTVADHYPLTKRELQRRRMDEHDPRHGRGLCEGCHNKHTAVSSPGGWHGGDAA